MNWFGRLRKGLFKTANSISSGLKHIFCNNKKLDQQALENIHDLLIAADISYPIVKDLIKKISNLKIIDNNNIVAEVKAFLSNEIATMLQPYTADFKLVNGSVTTLMLCGVNGNGKTTTAGKLAWYFKNQDKKVMLAACDTFRASAIEQLVLWSQKVGCAIVAGQDKQDPTSIAYSAQLAAQNQSVDLLIIDTAGRIYSNQNLMSELEKTVRVLKKVNQDAPQEIIMVLDGSTGQNALQQLESFMKVIKITGIIVTKLDSNAKGGILLTLTQKCHIPIYAIGIGEDIEDLDKFDPKMFADAIFV